MKERDIFEEIVNLGKRRGVLTYDEINEAPPLEFFSPDELEDLMDVLSDMGVKVVDYDAMARGAIAAESLNLGNGEGFSVREIVEAVGRVVGTKPPVEVAPRRAGDPANLVASSDRARRRLGWDPKWSSVESILETAWRWHRGQPRGYDDRP